MKPETCYKKLFLIFALCFVLFSLPPVGEAAILYLSPQSQTVYQGESFLVDLRIDTEGEEINAVETNLIFPPYLLEAIDYIKGNSILTLWAKEPKIQKGEINSIGGIPQGLKGDGLILKISFLGKEIGKEDIVFKEDSKVLLNDGKGTPARLTFRGASCAVTKRPEELPQITSNTHPDQNKWYKTTTLQLYWDLIEGTEYSWILSRDPLAEPDEIQDKPLPKEGVAFWMGAMEYDLKGEGDGIYYFSLRECTKPHETEHETDTKLKCGPRAIFRAMIDTTPPEEFKPEIGRNPAVFEGKYFLSFSTTDKTSGIDHYQIAELRRTIRGKEPKPEWKIGESPYLLEDQSLRSIIKVKAVDKAGNERISEIVPPYKLSFEDIIILLLILIGIGAIWYLITKLKRNPEGKPSASYGAGRTRNRL